MRTVRIYHPGKLSPGKEIQLQDQAARHAVQVLRLAVSSELDLFNGDGNEYKAHITRIERHRAWVQLDSCRQHSRESMLHITLGQVISKGDRMDYALQKAVELGVSRISPLFSQRSVVKLSPERLQKRQQHWQGIMISACEQCGRTVLPQLDQPMDLAQWVQQQSSGRRLVLAPDASEPLGKYPPADQQVTLLIGPEGGLSEDEIQFATSQGFEGIGLGPRILRTETATVAAVTLLQYLWGDLNLNELSG